MRLLILGANPKMESGMGKTGLEIAKGLAADHDVHYFAPQETGKSESYEGFTLHGSPSPASGGEVHFPRVVADVEPDIFFSNRNWQSLQWLGQSDSTLNSQYIEDGRQIPVVLYGPPVESEDKPPLFEQRLLDDHLNDVYLIPFTEARYEQYLADDEWDLGEYAIPEDAGVPGWVPHGVDHDIFYPDEGTRESWRDESGIGDRFLVQFVGENWRRKNIDVLFEGFARFAADVDGNPILGVHSPPISTRGNDEFYSGWDLKRLAIGIGLEPPLTGGIDDDVDVFWTQEYPGDFAPRGRVATFIDAADVYALPTGGEAFSLTTLEAHACMTPVVQTDVRTLRWLSDDAAEYITVAQDSYINSGERHVIPSPESLATKLRWLYEDKERWGEMAAVGYSRAQAFSWDRTATEMKQAIEWVAEDAGVEDGA